MRFINESIDIIDILSGISLETPLEIFLNQILESAIGLCPGFEAGSIAISLSDGKPWKYVVWKNFSDELSDIPLDPESDVIPSSDDPVIMSNIFEKAVGKIPEDVLKAYERVGSRRIEKTISVGLFDKKRIIGAIFIDSFDENVEVTDEMISTIRSYGKIASIFVSMKLSRERERLYRENVMKSMLKMMELRDPFTLGHSEKVTVYSLAISKTLKLDPIDLERVHWAALVHDIGKLNVPEYVLNKPTSLCEKEMYLIRTHPVEAEKVLSNFVWLKSMRIDKIVRHHHENWDGSGYPDGLKGEEIPFESRIISIADAFDAMTSPRSYRPAMGVEDAIREIHLRSGSQFDPYLSRRSLEVLRIVKG